MYTWQDLFSSNCNTVVQKIQMVIMHQVITFASGYLIELGPRLRSLWVGLSRPSCCWRKWPVPKSACAPLPDWWRPALSHKIPYEKKEESDMSIGTEVRISLVHLLSNRLITWHEDEPFSLPGDSSPPLSVKGLWETQEETSTCPPALASPR